MSATVPLRFFPRTVSGLTADQDADTYGWDTAFAIDFAHANSAITNGWKDVSQGAKKVSQAADDGPYNIDGELGPWQLTNGGDGRNVRMLCPFISGKYHAASTDYDLKGVGVVIQVGMEWVPNPDQFSFVIDGNDVVKAIADVLDQNKIPDALRAAFQKAGKPLGGGATALLQKKGLEWLITDGANNYYIFHTHDADEDAFLNVYQWQKAWANNLKVLSEEVSKEQPAVAIITVVNEPAMGSVAAAVLRELLNKWFNKSIAEFNHVFSALDLSPIVSKDDKWSWMKPTATSYAVTDRGTLASSVFGVVTMVQNHEPDTNHQISPYAIPVSKGANAGFLVSGPMFMRNMMLDGARAIFNNADASNFEVINDGLTVQNTKDLVWGKFMMDEKKRASVPKQKFPDELDQQKLPSALVDDLDRHHFIYLGGYKVAVTAKGSQWLLSKDGSQDEYILNVNGDNIDVYLATVVNIEKGRFKASLLHSFIEIEFTDLKYSYSLDYDVHIDYKEQVTMSLQDKNGHKIFWFDQIQKNMTVNVTKTKFAITREIIEAAIAAAVALLAIGSSIIAGLRAGAEVVTETEEGGEILIDDETFEQIAKDNPEEEIANEEDALLNAAEQSEGRFTRILNAFNSPKWKFFTAVAAAVAGGDALYQAIMEAVLKGEWEKVPAFDQFANTAIAPYTWPGAKNYTLTSGGLAGSLQIGLKVDAQ